MTRFFVAASVTWVLLALCFDNVSARHLPNGFKQVKIDGATAIVIGFMMSLFMYAVGFWTGKHNRRNDPPEPVVGAVQAGPPAPELDANRATHRVIDMADPPAYSTVVVTDLTCPPTSYSNEYVEHQVSDYQSRQYPAPTLDTDYPPPAYSTVFDDNIERRY